MAQVRYTISPKNAETVLKTENIRSTVEYLSDPSLGGRAAGTDGGRNTAVWLEGRFRDLALQPLGGAWMHGFTTDGLFGRNVLGFIPGCAQPAGYVLVMAHFDNLGTLGGIICHGLTDVVGSLAGVRGAQFITASSYDTKGRIYRHIILHTITAKGEGGGRVAGSH